MLNSYPIPILVQPDILIRKAGLSLWYDVVVRLGIYIQGFTWLY